MFYAIFLLTFGVAAAGDPSPQMLMDHQVVLDSNGRLLPWTDWHRILTGSMEYIKHCPTIDTPRGPEPWYLITSKLKEKGQFRANQNNQGSNAYFAVETLRRYLAWNQDKDAIVPVRLLLDRVMAYHTPKDWVWGQVPRTQDNTPDGCYTDMTAAADKICMTGVAYLRFAQLTGETKYQDAARKIARTVLAQLRPGDAKHSPLPFRVNLKTGEVIDEYTAGMVFCATFFEEMAALDTDKRETYGKARDQLWGWILAYPVKTNHWSGYYEDVAPDYDNMNQQVALETARYMLEHFNDRPEYRKQIPAIIDWVRNRFGKTRRFGAVSIREQDCCFVEMSSHTSRYASVLAGWWAACEKHGLLDQTQRDALREEARASLALCSYSTFSKYSQGNRALNYTGVGYVAPWFSDSYFDFLPHLIDGLTLLGELQKTK